MEEEDRPRGALDLDALIEQAPEPRQKRPSWGQKKRERASAKGEAPSPYQWPARKEKRGKPKEKGVSDSSSVRQWPEKKATAKGISRQKTKQRSMEQDLDLPPEPSEGKRGSRYASPYAYCVMLLARREYSRHELEQRLRQRDHTPEQIDQVLNRLAELGLQSDERFIESRVRQRTEKGYGAARMKMELRGHGIDEEAIEENLGTSEEFSESAKSVVRRRFGPTPLSLEQQRKALGLLLRRGFSYDQAMEAIRNNEE